MMLKQEDNQESVVIVIPARYNSTRLPGKPLADIIGKPMIQHVYERASKVKGVQAVIVATDDERIAEAVANFNGQVVMTSSDHLSGTDRLVEIVSKVPADIYINLQGDEPLIRPDDIQLLVGRMRDNQDVEIGTLCHTITFQEAHNPNNVKVVLADNNDALYFSRSLIPYSDDESQANYLKHIGVYAYRRNVLLDYAKLMQPLLEKSEKLEQLRLLVAGFRIRVYEVEPTGPGVDTPECLERARRLMLEPEKTIYKQQPSLTDIRLVITDVDGILTDGGLYYDSKGECLKRFHVRDGLGIKLLQESGVQVAVLSGRDSPALRKRLTDLDIDLYMLGVKDKAQACLQLMKQTQVSANQTACIGDDSIDLPAFEVCGLSFTVPEAPDYIRKKATAILKIPGGFGAFRELADSILIAQGKSSVLSSVEGYSSVMNEMVQ